MGSKIMHKNNHRENASRDKIVYYLVKASLREIIGNNMRMNYNNRENDCNGFKNPRRGEIVYLVMEREIIGIIIRFKMKFYHMLHPNNTCKLRI